MYLVNKKNNNIKALEKITFTQAGFKERQHLQEWIAKNPSCLGEELLIIQKEFAGFDDTKERLDLLALDKEGNIVVIENKLDDTGRDVVWQALKYVSYCSSLSIQDIEQMFTSYLLDNNISEKAEDLLSDFFGNEEYQDIVNVGYSQRTILVAGSYRKEVTSTVMWLLNNGIDITCFKATPYSFNQETIVDFNQIIPLQEAEDYIIKIAEKQQKEVANKRLRGSRHHKRREFWTKFLEDSNKKTLLTQNLNPTDDHWIGVGLGMSGVTLNLVVTRSYARSEIFINRGKQEINKETFDVLEKDKGSIEKELGQNLTWERMDDKVTSRIKWEKQGVSIFKEDDHEEMISFLIMSMQKMHDVFRGYVANLNR